MTSETTANVLPIWQSALPPADETGTCRLEDASQAIYMLARPVATAGLYTRVVGPEGGRADVRFTLGIPGFLANYTPYKAQPWQWNGRGGVRLVKDPSKSGDGNALSLWEMEGNFTWPGASPHQWSGVKALAYTLDCSLATWESTDGWPPIDLFGVYSGQQVSPLGVIAQRGGITLTLLDAQGPRTILGTFPGGPLPPNTRGTIGISLDNVKGLATLTFNGTTIGSGAFTPPIAENVDGQFCIGGQRIRLHHDPDMTFYGATVTADSKTSTVVPPASPDWWFPEAFVMADPLATDPLDDAHTTNFARLRIMWPSVGIAYGSFQGRATVDDVEIYAGNVGLLCGANRTSNYMFHAERVIAFGAAVAGIKAFGTIGTFRDIQLKYMVRHGVLARSPLIWIDGLLVAPGPPSVDFFKIPPSEGDRSLLSVRGACFDWEGYGPTGSYLDADASGRDGPGGTVVTFEHCAFGGGSSLANLRSTATQAPGSGLLTLRNCVGDMVDPAINRGSKWTVSGVMNG